MEGTQTQEALRAELVAKAAEDDGFRATLIADLKAAIRKALGVELPESVAVHVHEETAHSAHLVLPPDPSLTEGDLEAVAAGHTVRSGLYAQGAPMRHKHEDEIMPSGPLPG